MTVAAEIGVQARNAEPISVWERLRRAIDVASYRPRLREGLLWRHFTSTRGEEYVIIQNPAAATYLRLSPEDFFLFERMDGNHSVQDLVVEFVLKFRKFALQPVVRLVADLRNNAFLVDPPYFTYGALKRRARARQKARHIGGFVDSYVKAFIHREFPISGIDNVLTRVYRAGVWILFTRPVLILLALIAVVGVPLFVWRLFSGQVPLSLGRSVGVDLPLYYAFLIMVALTHESAHAFTVKSYGRVVRRGGFSLFYGLPSLFVDTQDIWMEPRRARLAASWAGPYSGFILTGLAGLVLTVAPDAPWAPLVAIFGVVAFVNNLFQLMPLIQLDGYFMLMDWLEIPRLRHRALAFVRHDLWIKLRRRQRLNREERIFAVFGVLAALYTVYAVFFATSFWWTRASQIIRDVLQVPNLGSLLGLILVLLLLIPFAIGIVRRILRGGQTAITTARRATGLAQERRYRERVLLLAQVPVLARLGKEQIQWLARRLREESFSPGTTVVRQGEPGDHFYLIVEGQAEVVVEDVDSARVVATLGPLDYFGERALLNRAPRASTIRAQSQLRLLSVRAEDFQARLSAYVAKDATLRARFEERTELDGFPLFESLKPKEKDLLLSRLRPETYAPGQRVIRQDDPGEDFYLIRAGRVEVTHRGASGGEIRLAELGPGEFFGETALLLDVKRTATVHALEETQLWAVSKQDFLEILGRYFNLAETFEATARERLTVGEAQRRLVPEIADTTAQERLPADQAWLGLKATSKWLDVNVGDVAPDFELESVQGGKVALSGYQGQKVLLWFSRGYTCPFCRKYMDQLCAGLPRFREAAVQIIQVAPNLVEQARTFWRGQDLPWPFLCDPDKSTYRLYGLCDLGAVESNQNTVKSFTYAFTHGEGGNTVRGSWLDVMNSSFSERLGHHALTAMQQGVFIIDAAGIVRHKCTLGPLETLPSNEELLAAATSMTPGATR